MRGVAPSNITDSPVSFQGLECQEAQLKIHFLVEQIRKPEPQNFCFRELLSFPVEKSENNVLKQ